MIKFYVFVVIAATAIIGCARSGINESATDDRDSGMGGSSSVASSSANTGTGGASGGGGEQNKAVPCFFAGSVKIVQCHDAQLGSVPYCGYGATMPFDDCVSPGASAGDNVGVDQGWDWYCCPASHIIQTDDAGAP